MKFTLHETFNAPPETVFAAMTDLEQLPRWMNGVEKIEPLTEGGFVPGARFRETRKMQGKTATEEFVVGQVEPPHRWQLQVDGSKGSSGRGRYDFRYHLRPIKEGSALEMQAEISGMGLLGELLGFLFMKRMFRKNIAKDHAALKTYLQQRDA